MMVAIPELDGADCADGLRRPLEQRPGRRRRATFIAHPERVERLAARVARLVALRRAERAKRKVAIVLFNFPPNAGATGTAAFLGVYESLFNTLMAMQAAGYTVDVPATVDALRERILDGNAARFGTRRQRRRAHAASTITSGARRISPRSRRNGARRRDGSRPTAPRSSCSASSSAMSSSACSRPSATKAIRCGCCSSAASRRRTPSPPSIAICARISAPTRCCISARTARSSSCRASRSGCPAPAGRTG